MAADSDSDLTENLLALPAFRREDYLRSRGLLNEPGLSRLLDTAEDLVHSDPGHAQRLAEACAELAEAAGAPAIEPRAHYLSAQTHATNGEFERALLLADKANEGYLTCGRRLEALRTHVGKMAVLLELGHYDAALQTGQTVLDKLAEIEESSESEAAKRESTLIAALVYQNQGVCQELMGRYGEALDSWTFAGESYEALGMIEKVGEIKSSQGLILSYLGRSSEAIEAHEAARSVFQESGLTLSYVQTLINLGDAHLRTGNYTRSLEAFEQARRSLARLDALADENILLLDTANAYLALNLYSEALSAYQEVTDTLQTTGMVYERARALWGMGSTLVAQSRFEEAERTLAEAASLFSAAGNVPLLSGVLLEQAALLEARGDHELALEKAREALDSVSEGDWPVQTFYAHLRVADLLLPDRQEAAEPHLLEAQRIAERLALPNLRYRINERLGDLRRHQGRSAEAKSLLRAAVEEIERIRVTVVQEAMRTSFLRDKVAAYEGLLQEYLSGAGEREIRRAFEVAEQAKSRALVDLITGIVARTPATDLETQDRVQELQDDLNAIYNQILGGRDEETPLPALSNRAAELETEINRLRMRTPGTTTSDPFSASSTGAVYERLADNESLVAYHVVEDEILAFVVTSEGPKVARELGPVSRIQGLLQRFEVQMDRFRAGQGFTERHMEMMHRSVQRVLDALYHALFAPLEELLEDAGGEVRSLAIVPHGLLHRVPFHALFDGDRYLLERFEISYAPSATVYALCQERASGDLHRALVLGLSDPLIPAATREARAVAQMFPDSELLIDEEATVEALREGSAGCGVLHLACHGLFRNDNPMFSSLKFHDGWLTAADAMQLEIEGALVTLSACESGRNEVIGGDEILGLTRAFLGAGAATLVVSLWLVQDETTAELMQRWYRHLREGLGRAEALRKAQLEIKTKHPHPYYWAPFVLVGKR
jgi:CHAT domain-containing protein